MIGRETIDELIGLDGERATAQPTSVDLGWHPEGLWVRFVATDTNPWASHSHRDAPLWEENVVEIFLAAGPSTPRLYREVEVNPTGAVFDALVDTPNGDRRDWQVDASWDWPGLAAQVSRTATGWQTDLWLPWIGLGVDGAPPMMRANLFRIDRLAPGAPPDHTCWSTPAIDPPDFHRPARFGLLVLEGLGDQGQPWPPLLPALLVPQLPVLPSFLG